MKASSQAADWADTLSIWIHPSGTLARNLGHRDEPVDEGEPLTDLEHQALMDEDSQRLGLTLLNLLNTEPKTNPMQGDAWKGFMLALSFSGDLLTSLTHAITNPLAEDLNVVSLQGVESLYTEFVEVKRWMRDGPSVQTIITLLISEGMLSKVLEKTCLYSQLEGSQLNTNTADLLFNTQPASTHNGCTDRTGAQPCHTYLLAEDGLDRYKTFSQAGSKMHCLDSPGSGLL